MQIVEVDQATLRDLNLSDNQVELLLKKNLDQLQQIISEIGWPTISGVGAQASQGAWLITQHSGFDLQFQKEALAMMIAQPSGEVRPSDIAYLTDRVMLAEQGVQKYGTQIKSFGDYAVVKSVLDTDKVDELRAELGMESLDEYFKEYEEAFGIRVFRSVQEGEEYLRLR